MSDGSIKTSWDDEKTTLPDGMLLAVEGWGEDSLGIWIIQEPTNADMNVGPADPSFSLEDFAKRYEKWAAKRDTGAKNTIQRVTLAQRKQGDDIIIDHEYYVLAGGDPASKASFYQHFVFVYQPNGQTTLLGIEYPNSSEKKWGAAMKAVAQSLTVSPGS